MRKGKYERLINCTACHGKGNEWDPHLKDYTIDCANCVGEGQICGECYFNVDSCAGEGVCWDQDPDELFDPTEEY